MSDYVIERYVRAISGNSSAQYAYGLDLRAGLVVPQSPEKFWLLFLLPVGNNMNLQYVLYNNLSVWIVGYLAINIQHITDKSKQKTTEQALKILQTWSSK